MVEMHGGHDGIGGFDDLILLCERLTNAGMVCGDGRRFVCEFPPRDQSGGYHLEPAFFARPAPQHRRRGSSNIDSLPSLPGYCVVVPQFAGCDVTNQEEP
jgi:hypothetical protein